MDNIRLIDKLKKLGLYYRTLRHLKFRQVIFQVWYRGKKIFLRRPLVNREPADVRVLILQPSISSASSFNRNCFIFLNKTKCFDGKIDWNFSSHGKLWTYNLNYFDFINQSAIDNTQVIELLESYCDSEYQLKDGVEPYPISLRGINWIKFFVYHKNLNPKFSGVLRSHYNLLLRNVEYHLLGNHLLENGFSLLFASYYFSEPTFYRKATHILIHELREQILEDGAHFELSPMYHQILLFRLLDCINLVKNNSKEDDSLLTILIEAAAKMLGWLRAITFSNGDIPHVNDSSNRIAPTSNSLFAYAERLSIPTHTRPLSSSGYRMIQFHQLELFVDIGSIGPDYIPGHAHSDTFNFILYFRGKPLIVDTGTSTYEANETRHRERSTKSHNTVVVSGEEQSEVWGSFRVGRRAKVIFIKENEQSITASHDGYQFIHITHQRSWHYSNQGLNITDELTGKETISGVAYLHFHPDIQPSVVSGRVVAEGVEISFVNALSFQLEDYQYARGFNHTEIAKALKINFNNRLDTHITPKPSL